MTEKEILELRDLAEVGKVQFKERVTDNYDIGCEMCAMSNCHGGRRIYAQERPTFQQCHLPIALHRCGQRSSPCHGYRRGSTV